MKHTATGKRMIPYSCDQGSLLSAKATIATDAPAKITDTWSHAKNVLSFAKKTLGSTLTGTFLSTSKVPTSPYGR